MVKKISEKKDNQEYTLNGIYTYYCLFFIGSILPFLIVESYLQDFFTIGILLFIALATFVLMLLMKYFRKKIEQQIETQTTIFNSSSWSMKKEAKKVAFYYFSNLMR